MTPSTIVVAPTLVQYSNGDQGRWADELQALPAGAMLRRISADYIALRDQVRAARAPARP